MNLSISEELLNRIKKINWFSNCGQESEIDSINTINYVKSWKEAKKYYQHQNWETTTLESRNVLTSFLSKHYNKEYQEWNNFTSVCRKFISDELSPELEKYKNTNKLDDDFIHCIKWDILNAIMEYVYKDAVDRPTFFLNLLEIYESGNFPCGWIGKWPQGILVVY